jgi:patatin-like phospholipase/acyl hydrolase
MSRFRILSIDGGGIKGVFPAAFLAAIEDNLPHPIVQYFDLITGTSTGGIIALGLGFGLRASQLLDFYVKRGPLIFPKERRRLWRQWTLNWFGSRYQSTALRSALTDVFGSAKLGQVKARVLIPSMNGSGHIHVYKTPYHPKLEMDYKVNIVDVALATSAAPTYLPPHVSPEGIPFLDGGLWANNPTGMAVVDALSMLDANRDNIEVLSLGCTKEPSSFSKVGRGKLAWAKAAIEAAMVGQSFASMGTALQLLGHNHVARINPEVRPNQFALDKTEGVEELRGLGYSQARYQIPLLRPRFFAEPAPPYQPFYSLDISQAAK